MVNVLQPFYPWFLQYVWTGLRPVAADWLWGAVLLIRRLAAAITDKSWSFAGSLKAPSALQGLTERRWPRHFPTSCFSFKVKKQFESERPFLQCHKVSEPSNMMAAHELLFFFCSSLELCTVSQLFPPFIHSGQHSQLVFNGHQAAPLKVQRQSDTHLCPMCTTFQ